MPTNWCWRRLLRVPWTARRSNRPILKGNQPWILIGGTDAEAEAPVFWSPDTNSQLIGKVPDVGKNWRQKKVSEDKMAGWHHRCNKHELEQPLGDDEGHRLNVLQSMGSQSQTQLGDWTTTTGYFGRKQIIKWPSMAGIGFVIQKPTGSYLINGQTLYLGKMMSDIIWYSF